MRIIFGASFAAALAVCSTPALAGDVVLEANGARSEGVWGGEVGLGYAVSLGGVTIRPVAGGFIYRGDNDRYYIDTFSNGQSRCRDSTNGEFVADRKCDNTAVKAYGKLEATYTLPGSLEFGAGGRYDRGEIRPYGLIGMPVAPRVRIQGSVGEKFAAIGLRASF